MDNIRGIFKRWIKFVELSTKLVSLTPFFIGTAFSLYVNGTINLPVTAILFIAVFFWSLTVTMINNFIDKRREGGVPHFSTGVSMALIIGTGGASMLLGLYLTWLCGLPVLIAGAICFGVGILYSFGPISISRTPYGEIASGLTEGFLVIFLAVFVNANTGAMQYADLRFDGRTVTASLDWVNMLRLLLLALPNMCCTSNIMLANNICDVERDAKNRRYTMPYYIGRSNALRLFQFLYVTAYIAILLAVAVGVLHPVSLAALLSAPLVFKNVKKFTANPVKSETFILSVKNYSLLLYGYFLTIIAGWAWNTLIP
jgi:1,4-dihydroxy-2-naphthoate polyprenyltransferase